MDIRQINEPIIYSIDEEIKSCMESLANLSPASKEYKETLAAVSTLTDQREKLINEIHNSETQLKKLEIEREIGVEKNEIEAKNGKVANILSGVGVGASIIFAFVGTFAEETRVIGTRAADGARKVWSDARTAIDQRFGRKPKNN